MSRTPTSEPMACRLLIDQPASGAWNMAVDAALLEDAAERDICTLRFYRWSEPTLSLGYFQSYQDRRTHQASRDCDTVRRMTGGGAILHDLEVTYSLTMPLAHSLADDSSWFYMAVHEALVETLYHFGLQAVRCDTPNLIAADRQPFLCFQRRAVGDVLLGEAKICGSAQRRRRGAILQHGSLLLGRSTAAPELPGLQELTGFSNRPEDITAVWAENICRTVNLRPSAMVSPPELLDLVRTLLIEQYSTNCWTQRR